MDLDRGCVDGAGGAVLTNRERELLGYLATRAGQAIERDDLLEAVWGHEDAPLTRAVDVAVWRLRNKLELDPKAPRHLLTVHGTGYRLVAEQAAAAPHRSPPDRFVGRQAELVAVEAALGPSIVTLVGPPGAGKTRLATELLARGGGVLVELAGARTAAELEGRVAAALDIPGEVARSSSVLADALRAHPGLVVLDNFEQLVDCAAETIARWSGGAARLLVTSRCSVGVLGETTIEVGPLPVEEALALFGERARRVRADFEGAPEVLERLVDGLDRLPLALELAAGRVGLFDAPGLLAGLEQRFEVLRTRRRDRPERHATLRAALEWSCALLAERDRTGLRRLAIFRGAFDLEAAGAVLEGSAIEVVGALLEASLIQVRETEFGRRYRLYEGVRDYAALEPEPLGASVASLADHFLVARAEVLAAEFRATGRSEPVGRILLDGDDLVAGVARQRDLDAELTTRAVLALGPALRKSPRFDSLALADTAVALAPSPALRAAALLLRARLRREVLRADAAEADLELASSLSPGLGLARGIDLQRARLLQSRGDPAGAEALVERWDVVGATDADHVEVLLRLGHTRMQLGRTDDATGDLERAAAQAEALGSISLRAWVRGLQCAMAYRRGDLEAAARYCGLAVELHHADRDRSAEAASVMLFGNLFGAQRRFEEAGHSYLRSAEMYRALGLGRLEGMALANLTLARFEAERPWSEVEPTCEAATALLRRHGFSAMEALAEVAAVGAALCAREIPAAERRLRRVEAIAADMTDRAILVFALTLRGAVEAESGRMASAEMAFEAAQDAVAELETRDPERAHVQIMCGFLDLARGDAPGARARLVECAGGSVAELCERHSQVRAAVRLLGAALDAQQA